MTDVIPVQRAPQTPKAAAVAKYLQMVRRTLLAPYADFEVLLSSYKNMALPLEHRERQWRSSEFLLPNVHGRWAVAEAFDVLARLPEIDDAWRLFEALEAAANAPASNNQNRMLIALMIERFPNASPHAPEAYMEGLIYDATAPNYSPHAVAAACQELVETLKFIPTVAEFKAACRVQQGKLKAGVATLRTAMDVRQRITDAIDEAIDLRDAACGDGPPLPWPYEPVLAAQKAEEDRLRKEQIDRAKHEMEAARARREGGEVQF